MVADARPTGTPAETDLDAWPRSLRDGPVPWSEIAQRAEAHEQPVPTAVWSAVLCDLARAVTPDQAGPMDAVAGPDRISVQNGRAGWVAGSDAPAGEVAAFIARALRSQEPIYLSASGRQLLACDPQGLGPDEWADWVRNVLGPPAEPSEVSGWVHRVLGSASPITLSAGAVEELATECGDEVLEVPELVTEGSELELSAGAPADEEVPAGARSQRSFFGRRPVIRHRRKSDGPISVKSAPAARRSARVERSVGDSLLMPVASGRVAWAYRGAAAGLLALAWWLLDIWFRG